MHFPPTFPLPAEARARRPRHRCVVTLRKGAAGVKQGLAALQAGAGVKRVVRADDFRSSAMRMEELDSADAAVFPKLGFAVVYADDALRATIGGIANAAILRVHSGERYYMLANPPGLSLEYLRGYRDAVNHLHDAAAAGETAAGAGAPLLAGRRFATPADRALPADALAPDETEATWGLQLTGVTRSTFTGAGIKIAVLDTGFNSDHPDFAGRPLMAASFIPNESASDNIGHGTHCAGTACGGSDASGRRYGIAPAAELFVGKVLGGLHGEGEVENIMAGIEWALANRCDIISMSLGSATIEDPQRLEELGRRALQQGCLVIAAAGNNADREASNFGSVEHPANCDSIMAVAALDRRRDRALDDDIDRVARVWNYSATGTGSQGGRIDLAAPGAGVYSAWRGSLNLVASGTSMAAPHVAGIAALWAEQSGLRGQKLWDLLIQKVQRLNLSDHEAGAGLVQAP